LTGQDVEKRKVVHYENDIVTFDSEDDPENPMNFSNNRKLAIVSLNLLLMEYII